MVETNHPICHLLTLVTRHPTVIRRLQIQTLVNELCNSFSRLIPVQLHQCIRLSIAAPCQFQTSAVIVGMGIICTGKCMTAAAHTVSVFQKRRAFCFLFVIKVETVRCQSAIRIRPAACKESIDLIFRDKNFLLIPLKALSCLIRLERESKLLKLFRYFVRAIELHPHHAFIFGIGFCQPQKTFVQVSQKFRLVKHLCKAFCKFRVSTGENRRIGKDHL